MKKSICIILALLLSFSSISAFADIEGTVQGDIMLTSVQDDAAEGQKLVFNDVVAGTQLSEVVSKFTEAGILAGYGDGTFRPNNGLTRAELCKIINVAFGFEKSAAELKFTDVTEDDWYYSYVLVAVEEGYIKGFHDNTFRGEDPVTREQACAIINRVTAAKGITLFDIPLTEQITDEISDWAVEDVKKIVANFVMPVEEGGKFRATQDITRAELVLSLDMFVAQPVKEYTVTFETNGGSAIESVKVAEGNKISKPADPKKANYTFSGWYSDKTLKIAYDFSAEVAADITLYAKWTSASGGGGGGGGGGSNTPTQYTVTFETNGGSTIASVKVTAGSMFAKPKDPTKSDCYFAGWYKDAAFKNAYAFNESVNGNITIYAKWYTKAERLADLKILKNVLDATEVEETAHQEAMAIILDTFVKVIAGGEAGAYIDEAYITSNFTSNINSLKSKWNAMDEDTKDNLEFILLDALDDAHKAGFSMKSSEVYSLFNSIAGDILG